MFNHFKPKDVYCIFHSHHWPNRNHGMGIVKTCSSLDFSELDDVGIVDIVQFAMMHGTNTLTLTPEDLETSRIIWRKLI